MSGAATNEPHASFLKQDVRERKRSQDIEMVALKKQQSAYAAAIALLRSEMNQIQRLTHAPHPDAEMTSVIETLHLHMSGIGYVIRRKEVIGR